MLSEHIARELINIEQQIAELQLLKKTMNAKVEELEEYKEAIKANALSPEQVDALRVRSNETYGGLARIEQELQSLELKKVVITGSKNIAFERIIIGAGVAGTLLFSELPFSQRAKTTPDGLPAIIVINDPMSHNQWRKDGHTLMGQPAQVQTPPVFSSHSEDFACDEISRRNPYQYVMADDFYHAMVVTQMDLGMPVLNLTAVALESRDSLGAAEQPWEHNEYPHRIAVQVADERYYLYTSHIDFCAGPGPTRKLTASQIDPAQAEELVQQSKIIYGQNKSDLKLQGTVVFYGGGGRNASMILDILNGHQPGVKNFAWIARNGEDFDNNAAFNRMFHDLDEDPRSVMKLAELVQINPLSNGQLELIFGKPTKTRKAKQLDEAEDPIICDQLVVAIGQEAHPLTKNLQGFLPCQLETPLEGIIPHQVDVIPLGTCSADGSIMTWGASGALGTGLEQKKAFTDAVQKHAEQLPRESRATVGIFRSSWTVKQMASQLGQIYPDKFDVAYSRDLHSFELPNINYATRGELHNLIYHSIPAISAENCLKIADNILEIRSKLPMGIENPDMLRGKIPAPVFLALTKHYFPFHSLSNGPKIKIPSTQSVSRPIPVRENSAVVTQSEVVPSESMINEPVSKQTTSLLNTSPRKLESPNPSLSFFGSNISPAARALKPDTFDTMIEELNTDEDQNIQLPSIKKPKETTNKNHNEEVVRHIIGAVYS